MHDCEIKEDFRAKQCELFNGKLFQGSKYLWEPYLKEGNECELNCKPVGMNYFATLNETVADGTPCNQPAEYFTKNFRGSAVCINGICKVISNYIILQKYCIEISM